MGTKFNSHTDLLLEIETECVDAERMVTLLQMGAIFCDIYDGDPVKYVGPASDTLETLCKKLHRIRDLATGDYLRGAA